MRLDVHSLPDDPTELKQIIATLSSSYQDKVHHLEEQVRLLRNEIFGRKSEKRLPPQDERQQRLFDEADGGGEVAEEASPSQ
jgi:hypothetical protein